MSSFFPRTSEVSVLIVDDDEVSREVLATLFTIDGFEVLTARDGIEALAMLDSGGCSPNVVLMDLRMPGLHGAELILKLRERLRPESATILLTMSASQPHVNEVKGSDGFLRKPFGAKELKRMLEECAREAAKLPEKPKREPVKREEARITAHAPDSTANDVPAAVGSPSAEGGVLDEKKLAALKALMPEAALRQIYTTAVDDLSQRMPGLENAIARGDAKMVRHIGHAIKGGCGMVGAVDAAKLGALLEEESDQLDNSRSITRQLRSAIEALKGMLDREFPG
jgi:CheY-like chemotaxis protein